MVPGVSFASERSVSPVVGGVLMLGIVVLLVGASAVFVFQLTEEQTPAPETAFDLERTDSGAYELVHEAGPELDGDRVTLRGVADPDVLRGRTLSAGQSVVVFPQDETVRIVWIESEGNRPPTSSRGSTSGRRSPPVGSPAGRSSPATPPRSPPSPATAAPSAWSRTPAGSKPSARQTPMSPATAHRVSRTSTGAGPSNSSTRPGT
ncbi:type IV pilin [Halomicroarcula sp. GCM10025709]|uniref:type IV pilin n=1 Tax=Halomicroarcula sp. GCM10025709 TaxID=3252669 RepID=UPI003619A735